jgi:hypothetical protein
MWSKHILQAGAVPIGAADLLIRLVRLSMQMVVWVPVDPVACLPDIIFKLELFVVSLRGGTAARSVTWTVSGNGY